MRRDRPRREPPWWAPTLGTGVVVVALVGGVLGVARPWETECTGCDDPPPRTAARRAAGVTMLMETSYPAAIAPIGGGGVLQVLPGGCLGLTDPDGSHPRLAVFPPRTRIRAERGRPVLDVSATDRLVGAPPSDVDGDFRPGDLLAGGTTGGPVTVKSYGSDLAEHVPAPCRRYRAQYIYDIERAERRG